MGLPPADAPVAPPWGSCGPTNGCGPTKGAAGGVKLSIAIARFISHWRRDRVTGANVHDGATHRGNLLPNGGRRGGVSLASTVMYVMLVVTSDTVPPDAKSLARGGSPSRP